MRGTIRPLLPTIQPAGRRGGPPPIAPLLALALALAAPAARADSDYPKGLFENSPVVPHGYVPPETPPAAPAPGDAGPPGPDAGLEPDAGAPAWGDNPPPPGPPAAAGGYGGRPPGVDAGFCAGVATRTFHSLEEVRRAHMLCDQAAAPPGY